MARINRRTPDAKPTQYHPWHTEYKDKSIPGVRPQRIPRKGIVVSKEKKEVPQLQEEIQRDTVSERPRVMYDKEKFPYIAEVLCRNYGMTNKALGVVFGVSEKTIEGWIYKNPEFKKGVQAGKDDFDSARIEQSLLKRATGYQYTEKTVKTVRVKAKHKYEDYELFIPAVETTITRKELPPDVKAIMFWLTNRSQERWRMVTTVNANIKAKSEATQKKVTVSSADIGKMNTEQLKALRDIIKSRGEDGSQVIEINGPDSIEDVAMNMIDYVQGIGVEKYQEEMMEDDDSLEGMDL